MSKDISKTGEKNAIEKKASVLAVFTSSVLVGLLALQSVSWMDVFFPVFASVYVYIMFRVAFPTVGAKPAVGGWKFPGVEFLPRYVLFAAIIGLFLPLLQIVISFVVGDRTTLRESAPHLFLLCAQVLTENLTFSEDTLPLAVKAVVPVLYNAQRLVSLHTWAVAVFSRDVSSSLSLASTAWGIFGRSVVVSNVLLWHFNLWCFLLPFYVPWCLRTHYTGANASGDNHVE